MSISLFRIGDRVVSNKYYYPGRVANKKFFGTIVKDLGSNNLGRVSYIVDIGNNKYLGFYEEELNFIILPKGNKV